MEKHTHRSHSADVHHSLSRQSQPLDIIIAGGGINGAGIAAEAVSRGLTVGLYDAQDFAGATSSASSKLIHGGLRYLEYGELRLVKEALAERETLLTKAAHLIKPMRFRLPYLPHLRPKWQIKAGLFLYDHLAKRCVLKPSQLVSITAQEGLRPDIESAFEYSDCWVDDARLVICNIKQAHHQGAEVRNYCQITHAQRVNDLWKVTLHDERTNQEWIRFCRVLINATGPWAERFIEQYTPEKSPQTMRLVKGSHVIVPKLYTGDHAYILQHTDQRVVFVIPYLDRFSMIGTTDIAFDGDPYSVEADHNEIEYLLSVCNHYFQAKLETSHVIDHFSGVRPLFGDSDAAAQAVSRDYELSLQHQGDQAPLMSVFGGKLTTYRKLAAKAVDSLAPFFPDLSPTNSQHSIFTGSINLDVPDLTCKLTKRYPTLTPYTIHRLIEQYGQEVWAVMNDFCETESPIIPGFYRCELEYLIQSEWALKLDDVIKRRTKLCYDSEPQSHAEITKWLS
ncbi:glycerol-3-phosphate dehydrogenase [Vibrio renipiscarius]|uniref:glycerol-3-phosphate dehydrogenase n=1 Tax=Vibrio renipiscarius TaxID=1461322 RepID=UPI00069A7593|nr:glycerol-3-phosphate dehydrogenase [Vibrio renipiscarius]